MRDRIEPLTPADPVRGRRWADHRRTLEAIAWKYRTNSPRRDLPDKLGSFQTAHKRLIGWIVSVDSTVVRAPARCRSTRKKGGGPHRRARRSRARTLSRRPEHQDPPAAHGLSPSPSPRARQETHPPSRR
ncbi:transposase [Streptomyces sp. Je 1-369]|uniref:transposase n=1 Tax=Streptomyces sp. Je 1-369 TaxID=2966192 RepID=UPI002286A074|nr:transposase [Streptomyces sp. Je 1-369]WAM00091.1 transposase [Streptomyces sp. Je 1-369]